MQRLEVSCAVRHIYIYVVSRLRVKKGYRPRTNIAKDEKGDLVADYHSILVRWRIHFSQLFNVHGVNDVRKIKIYTAVPLKYR
jgi:hypothetical protein